MRAELPSRRTASCTHITFREPRVTIERSRKRVFPSSSTNCASCEWVRLQ